MTPLVAAKVLARNACTGAPATASFNSPSLRFWEAQSATSTRDSHSSRIASKSLKTNGRVSLYPERPGACNSACFFDTQTQSGPLAAQPVVLRCGVGTPAELTGLPKPEMNRSISAPEARGAVRSRRSAQLPSLDVGRAVQSGRSAQLPSPDARRAVRPGGSAGLLAPRKATLLIPGFSPGNSRRPFALLAARSSQPFQSLAGGYNL